MNQETAEILETIPKNFSLRVEFLESPDSQVIASAVALFSEDGSATCGLDGQKIQDTQLQQAKFVRVGKYGILPLESLKHCGMTWCDYHFQV
jgi:hypothetical protein